MKKLLSLFLLATAICHSLHAATASNPRNTLITAIARNDFGTVTKVLAQITDMSADEKQQYLLMADQIIASAVFWHTNHYRQPEIGKNLLASLGYFLATGLSASFATVIMGLAAEREYYDRPATKPAIAATVLSALAGYFGYRTISELITAWMKPSNRLENALRIRDAIFHYEVSTPNLSYDRLSRTDCIAIGSEALQATQSIDPSAFGTAVGCNHLSYEGHPFSDFCNCECTSCKNACEMQKASAYHINVSRSYALGVSESEESQE